MKNRRLLFIRRIMMLTLMCLFMFGHSAIGAEAGSEGSDSKLDTNLTMDSNNPAAVKVNFPDVPSTHWAHQYISKLSVLGVIAGDPSGNFFPSNSITQEQAIVMAIQLMGVGKELNFDTEVVLPFDVSKYAKPYVTLALDKGIINLQEELAPLVEGQLTRSWGTKPANREWVAKITIRAIHKQDMVNSLQGQSTSFTDNSLISPSAMGYINAAVNLKIVNGLPNGKFDPQGAVTRAQMAAFFSNAENHLSQRSSRLAKGLVLNMTDLTISLQNEAGQTKQYVLGNGLNVYGEEPGIRLASSDIKPYYQVELIHVDGIAYYVEITNQQTDLQTMSGKLVELSVAELTMSLLVNGNRTTYDLASNVSVFDVSGKPLTLGSLALNSLIEVKRNTANDSAEIVQITVKELPLNKTADGTIQSISGQELGVIDTGTTVVLSYSLAKDALLTYGDTKLSSVAELKMGDIVSYEVKNEVVTSIELIKPSLKLVHVTLEEDINITKQLMVVRDQDSKKYSAYEIANKAVIAIDGFSWPSLSDLEIGDTLTLSVNEKNIVEKIVVTSRDIEEGVLATIVSYEPTDKYLLVKDKLGSAHVYNITDRTIAKLENSIIDKASFVTLFQKDKKVILTLSQNDILSIDLSNKFNGIVTQLNTTQRTITLRTDSNQTMTFGLESALLVEMFSKSTGSLADIKEGDSVVLTFNWSQDKVSHILLKQRKIYRTVSKESIGNKLNVISDASGSITLTIDYNTSIVTSSGATTTFDSIVLGEPVIVTYTGKSVAAIEIADAKRGVVTAVDKVNGKLSVRNYSNVVQSYSEGTKLTVTNGSTVSANLNAINVQDRVEVVTAADGSIYIHRAPAEEKTFWNYDAAKNLMTFKRTTLNEKVDYVLNPKAYVHQGTQAIQLTSLKADDKLVLYILDGEIIEIEKK